MRWTCDERPQNMRRVIRRCLLKWKQSVCVPSPFDSFKLHTTRKVNLTLLAFFALQVKNRSDRKNKSTRSSLPSYAWYAFVKLLGAHNRDINGERLSVKLAWHYEAMNWNSFALLNNYKFDLWFFRTIFSIPSQRFSIWFTWLSNCISVDEQRLFRRFSSWHKRIIIITVIHRALYFVDNWL